VKSSILPALGLLASIALAAPAVAQTTIDFSAVGDGAPVPLTAHVPDGALFAVSGGTFDGYACRECASFGASVSGPNYAKIGGGAHVTVSFVDPGSGTPVDVADAEIYLFIFTFGATVRSFRADGTPGPACHRRGTNGQWRRR